MMHIWHASPPGARGRCLSSSVRKSSSSSSSSASSSTAIFQTVAVGTGAEGAGTAALARDLSVMDALAPASHCGLLAVSCSGTNRELVTGRYQPAVTTVPESQVLLLLRLLALQPQRSVWQICPPTRPTAAACGDQPRPAQHQTPLGWQAMKICKHPAVTSSCGAGSTAADQVTSADPGCCTRSEPPGRSEAATVVSEAAVCGSCASATASTMSKAALGRLSVDSAK